MKVRSGLFVLACSLVGGYPSLHAHPVTQNTPVSESQQITSRASGGASDDRFQACTLVRYIAIHARSLMGSGLNEPLVTEHLIKRYADQPRVQSYLGSREDTAATIRQITTSVSLTTRELRAAQLPDYSSKGFLVMCLRSGDQESVGML
jgi:hypothetical protein